MSSPRNLIPNLRGGVSNTEPNSVVSQFSPDVFATFGWGNYLTTSVHKPSHPEIGMNNNNNLFADNSSSDGSLTWPPSLRDILLARIPSSTPLPSPPEVTTSPETDSEYFLPPGLDATLDCDDEEFHCLSQHCIAKHAEYITSMYTPKACPVLYTSSESGSSNSSDSGSTRASSRASTCSSSSGNGRGIFVAFPSPETNSVSLTDILSFKPGCMIGADEQVLQELFVSGRDCWIQVMVKGVLYFKDPFYLPINCECAVVTRAKIAWDIAMVIQVYLNAEKMVQEPGHPTHSPRLTDLRLRSIQQVSDHVWHVSLIQQRHSNIFVPQNRFQGGAQGGRGHWRGAGHARPAIFRK